MTAAKKKHLDSDLDFSKLMKRQESAPVKFPPFEIKIDGHLSVERAGDKIVLHSYFHYFHGVVEHKIPGVTEIDATLFKDEQQVEKWAATINHIFKSTITDVLGDEAHRELSDIVHFVLSDMQIDDEIDLDELAKYHAKRTLQAVRTRLGLRRDGQRSLWSQMELARAVFDALVSIENPRERTYERVAAALKARHPDKAPEGGDALRKVLKRLGVNWKRIKKDAERHTGYSVKRPFRIP